VTAHAPVGVGMPTESEVDTLDVQLDAQMTALDVAVKACSAMAPSDVTVWAGVFAGWKAVHAQWDWVAHSPWINPGGKLVEIFFLSDMFHQMQGFAAQLPIWQARVQQACGGYKPPPAIVVPPPEPARPPGSKEPLEQFADAAKAVGWGALAMATAYGVFKVAELAGVISKGVRQ
jgi:hypothetical protein